MASNLLRLIPSVEKIKNADSVRSLTETHGEEQVSAAVRFVLDGLRDQILDDKSPSVPEERLDVESIAAEVSRFLASKFTPSLRKAVNATGVIMHTGLGRAAFPLPLQIFGL